MRLVFFAFVVSLMSFSAFSQLQGIHISRTSEKVKVDGVLDDEVWKVAEKSGDFRQYFPADTSKSIVKTEMQLAYDNNFIYIAAKMFNIDGGPGSYVTPSLRRDYRGEANDGISVVFDTFKDKTNAFLFGVNPFGVQREGLISNGGDDGRGRGNNAFSLDWDNKWFSEVVQYEGYWVAEFAIPFKTLRFKEGLSSWNINFYRIDSQTAERSSWSPIPRNFSIASLAFNRELIWDTPLKKTGSNISVIPYGAAGQSQNFEEGTPKDGSVEIGGDAKIAINSALNLDLTINPDFSQVEVDQQVTNLDRFEIFFPERRQFFLENADLFSDYGEGRLRPFFSRRIGVARDTSTGQNLQNKIYGGARLSGKINNNLRVGLLNMQAGKDEDLQLPSTNYTVATVQQKIFSRSNISAIFVNKQAFQDSIGGAFNFSPQNYNRLIGLDYNLASRDNLWNGKFFYHRSFDQDALDSTFAMGANLVYSTLKWEISSTMQNIGANYNPEVGFAPRVNYLRLAPTAWYNFYPTRGPIQSHGPGLDFDVIGNEFYGVTDYDINLMYRMRFTNTGSFNMRLRREYVYLFDDFDPTNTDGPELPSGTSYGNYVIIARYNSDARRKVAYQLNTRSGGYFNGSRINLDGNVSFRIQPYGSLSMDFSYDRIRLPEPYKDADLILVGPRFDITFTRKLFWTSFFQYNSQINNLNINSRLQWRFKPVSDLFIVYTDNYFASSFENGEIINIGKPKSRALVLKLTYWLNL
ncbi:MAG: DUF5916 domain-containing protein [Cyclobacteriaceae bacterium]